MSAAACDCDGEIVFEFAGGIHGLGTHACGRAHEVVGFDVRHQPLQRPRERCLAQRAPHFARSCAPVATGESPQAAIGDVLSQLCPADVAPAVALAGQREHGVGAGVDRAVDHAGQVHTEKREAGVGHRVNEVVDEVRPFGHQLVVLATERDDPVTVRRARQFGHLVASQASTVDQPRRFQIARRGGDAHAIGGLADLDHPRRGPQFGSGGFDLGNEDAAHGPVVRDAGAGNVQRLDAGAVRLELGQPLGVDDLGIDAVAPSALCERRQPLLLWPVDRNDYFAAHLVCNVVPAAELDHGAAPGDRQCGLGRPRPVVHT